MMVMALGETCGKNEEGYHLVVSQTDSIYISADYDIIFFVL
jgi:hypothetical protein